MMDSDLMDRSLDRSRVALFVALTRAVRDAAAPHQARLRAYELIDRMADAEGGPGFVPQLDAFAAFAGREPCFSATLEPYWTPLRSSNA